MFISNAIYVDDNYIFIIVFHFAARQVALKYHYTLIYSNCRPPFVDIFTIFGRGYFRLYQGTDILHDILVITNWSIYSIEGVNWSHCSVYARVWCICQVSYLLVILWFCHYCSFVFAMMHSSFCRIHSLTRVSPCKFLTPCKIETLYSQVHFSENNTERGRYLKIPTTAKFMQ